jgi:2-keto-4-pentenoate hydratase/2-oxohepta-3-ene-1,7-dioic acid hydratase in catechol pathway
MKLVTFAFNGALGAQRRLGAVLDEQRIVDLTSAYATYLAQRTDEPTPRELAALRTPPDMLGFLRAQHKGREAAEQALAFARELGPDARGLDDARLVFERSEVGLTGNTDSIIGPEDPIPFPYYTDKLDLELEIGIIVGKGGRNLSLHAPREPAAV